MVGNSKSYNLPPPPLTSCLLTSHTEWTFSNFEPMASIPTSVHLTTYSGGTEEFMQTPLQEMMEQISTGELRIPMGKVFRFEEIVEAHRMMEEGTAGGKIVVLV